MDMDYKVQLHPHLPTRLHMPMLDLFHYQFHSLNSLDKSRSNKQWDAAMVDEQCKLSKYMSSEYAVKHD